MASDAAVSAFTSERKGNGLLILPTGAGKSLVIADIAHRLNGPLLILQPQKEILEQNFEKLQSYGCWDCSIYSASVGVKDINRITFATIGSVMNHMDDFAHFENVIIDECHKVNSKEGQYEKFLQVAQRSVDVDKFVGYVVFIEVLLAGHTVRAQFTSVDLVHKHLLFLHYSKGCVNE